MYDTLTDGRDGQTYKTVKIGKQTWMAQNLNYQTKSGSWCYDNKADNCKQYGRLYDWKTAATVCPKGWKLPSRKDWDSLGQAVGGEKVPYHENSMIYWYGAGNALKARSGWKNNGNGTDNYGFSALPGGYRRSAVLFLFYDAGNYGYWWTATESSDGDAYYRDMYYDNDGVRGNNDYKSYGFSVRCVADTP
jgi:uncharacterized protein (TIGR02145 family)